MALEPQDEEPCLLARTVSSTQLWSLAMLCGQGLCGRQSVAQIHRASGPSDIWDPKYWPLISMQEQAVKSAGPIYLGICTVQGSHVEEIMMSINPGASGFIEDLHGQCSGSWPPAPAGPESLGGAARART